MRSNSASASDKLAFAFATSGTLHRRTRRRRRAPDRASICAALATASSRLASVSIGESLASSAPWRHARAAFDRRRDHSAWRSPRRRPACSSAVRDPLTRMKRAIGCFDRSNRSHLRRPAGAGVAFASRSAHRPCCTRAPRAEQLRASRMVNLARGFVSHRRNDSWFHDACRSATWVRRPCRQRTIACRPDDSSVIPDCRPASTTLMASRARRSGFSAGASRSEKADRMKPDDAHGDQPDCDDRLDRRREDTRIDARLQVLDEVSLHLPRERESLVLTG